MVLSIITLIIVYIVCSIIEYKLVGALCHVSNIICSLIISVLCYFDNLYIIAIAIRIPFVVLWLVIKIQDSLQPE